MMQNLRALATQANKQAASLQAQINAQKHHLNGLINWWKIQNLIEEENLQKLQRSEDPRVKPPSKIIVV